MTITTNPARNEYTANAGQTVFNYTFKIFENTDLNVYVTPAGQECTGADLTTAYIVDNGTIGDPAGGFITLNTPTGQDDLVTIVLNVPSSRTIDYQNNGDFRPDTVNDDFDRVVSIAKKTEERVSRTLQFSQCLQNSDSLSLPTPEPGKAMLWNADKTGLENFTPSTGNAIDPSEDLGSYTNYEFDTVANAKIGLTIGGQVVTLKENDVIRIKERESALFDVITGTGTANGYNIIAHSALDLSFSLRVPNSANVKEFGAIGDDITDDTGAIYTAITFGVQEVIFPEGVYFLDESSLFALPNNRIDVPTGVKITSRTKGLATITTNINNSTSTSRVVFFFDGQGQTFENVDFDCAKSASIQKVITVGINATNPVIRNVTVRNMYSDTFLWAITVNAGVDNYKLDNISFIDLDVFDNGVEGDKDGSIRGIYIGYNEVGGDPGADLGFGDVTNIYGKNLLKFTDTDLIQAISNSGAQPFTHYSPIKIKGVKGVNVGKRLVKCQVNGCDVEDVYADATNINNPTGINYMFAIVAALNGSTTVRNVRGKGIFKTGLEAKDESIIEDVFIESTQPSGTALTGVHALILNEGGKTSRSTLQLTNLRTIGSWGSLLLNREFGYGDTTKVLIDNLYTENSTVNYCIGIFADNQVNNLELIKIENCVLGTLGGDPLIITTSNAGSGDKIDNIEIKNVTLRGASTQPISIDARSLQFTCEDVEDFTQCQNIIQTVCPNGVVAKNIKDMSGLAIAKRIANFSDSSNVFAQGCYSPTATTQAFRVNNGNNIVMTNNILASGIFPFVTSGAPTNVNEFDNYNFS